MLSVWLGMTIQEIYDEFWGGKYLGIEEEEADLN
jgi:hypothetical protein